MKLKKWILLATAVLISINTYSAIGPGHVVGKITNLTSINSGFLVRIGANETPENCTSNQAWLEIKQDNTALISLTLTAWTLGRDVVVYTSPASSGYCEVWQVDPNES